MAYIVVADVQAWAEPSKLALTTLEVPLHEATSAEVIGRLAGSFVTTTWTDNTNTPNLVRKIMAMMYVAWYISRTYASDEGRSDYGMRLRGMANDLIEGLIRGTIILVDDLNPANAADGTAQFYPNDASSALEPTIDDRSLGGPAMTMGVIW